MLKVVLAHGLPDNLNVWYEVSRRLSSLKVELELVRLPGFSEDDTLKNGTSLYEIARLVKMQLPMTPCLFVGHDFGGIIGAMIAATQPSSIERLILINAPTASVLKSQIENDMR